MNDFNRAFEFVVGAEGGFTDDPRDRGNWTTGVIGQGECRGTKYGISAMAYPKVDIAGLSIEQAQAIYFRDYWKPLCCDQFEYPVALCLFDCGVNQGIRRAIRFAQEVASVEIDGLIGPKTLFAIREMNPDDFVRYFLHRREKHYRSLASFSIYGKGWLNRLEHVKQEAMA